MFRKIPLAPAKRQLSRCKTTRSAETQNVLVDYQFLQRSKLPTMHFQPSLPRLPIPQLEKTCERYLAALRPVLIDESYRKTEHVVHRFQTKEGPQLQEILKAKDKANKHTSYISEPWSNMYLSDRQPLPLNYNPLLAMNHDPKPGYNDQLTRATNLVISSLRFMRSLRAEILEPEVFHMNPAKSDTDRFRLLTKMAPQAIATYVAYAFKAFPLDMSQYNGLFGATRIPEFDKDRIYRDDKSRHLIVMRRGNFYAVDVLDANGDIEPPNVILGRLSAVFRSEVPASEFPLGVLTAEERNKWASARNHLVETGNGDALRTIDSGLFCLCLDDDVTYDEKNPVPLVKHFLAGDGKNRWFDKSISLFVEKDGSAAVNFEHSWGDGVAVLRYFNEIYNETIKSPFVHPDTKPNTSDTEQSVRLLKFNLDDRSKQAISQAAKSHESVMNSLDIQFLKYDKINKRICKQHRVSPDSVMQLAFQLAHRQAFGKYVGSYESCSTAAFRHGRTETMRPCTMATKTFCDSVLSDHRTNSKELRAMIEQCSAVHGNLTKEAAMGQGFDRHLFGLRHIAEINGMEKPDIFKDAGYEILNYNIISTSTLSSPAMLAGGFGPVVKDGFGIGYSIQDDQCGSVVSTYQNLGDGKTFIESLREAFGTIQSILNSK